MYNIYSIDFGIEYALNWKFTNSIDFCNQYISSNKTMDNVNKVNKVIHVSH